ncbi:MAG: LysM peptidoglycan-binding domain-containing protein [Gemmatimonadetes bacterium]|nr:LysM peptidoglycan-binding domain-containing protein [Gemmatimonadota bacterium]
MARFAIVVVLMLGFGAVGLAQEAPRAPKTHTVRTGDTLWGLAREYLGDPFRWPALHEANRDRVSNPHQIFPGQELTIPAPGGPGEQPAVVQEVAVGPAPAQQPGGLPPEATERTHFYQTTGFETSGPTVLTRSLEERPAVLAPDHYAAGWIEPEPVSPGIGVVEAVSDVGATASGAQMARPFDQVRVSFVANGTVQVGDRLIVLRIERPVERYGRVVRPVGMLTVSRVEDGGAMAVVSTEFDRILVRDQVRPLEPFEERPGLHPRRVDGDVEARILTFRDLHLVQGFSDVAYLDAGSDRGVEIGDEFAVLAPAAEGGGPRTVGRLQVVDVRPATSTVRVVRADMPLSGSNLRARLAAKMP